MISKIRRLIPDFHKTWRKYPLAIGSAFLAFIFCLIEFEQSGETFRSESIFTKLAVVAILGIPIFTAIHIRVFRRGRMDIFSVVPILLWVLYGLYLFLTNDNEQKLGLKFVAVFILFHLIIALGFWRKNGTDITFWKENIHLFIYMGFSLIMSGILFGSIAAMIGLWSILFETHTDSKLYMYAFYLVFFIFNTIFFLSGIKSTSEDPEPAWVNKLTNFILTPISLCYLSFLLIYVGKMLFQGEIPSGSMGIVTMVFSVYWFLAMLLAYPRLIQNRKFTISTLVFIGGALIIYFAFFVAVKVRIDAYGFTELRYVLLIIGICCSVVSIWLLFNRLNRIWFIPLTLAICCVFVSFGPLSMFEVAYRSQWKRMNAELIENNLLKDGILQTWSLDSSVTNYSLNSKIELVYNQKGMEAFETMLPQECKQDTSYREKHILTILNQCLQWPYYYDYVADIRKAEKHFSVSADYNTYKSPIDLSGYDQMISFNAGSWSESERWTFVLKGPLIQVNNQLNEKRFTFDLSGIVEKNSDQYLSKPLSMLKYEAISTEGVKMCIYIESANGLWKEESPVFLNISGKLLYNKADFPLNE
jgi:hypothetical protein